MDLPPMTKLGPLPGTIEWSAALLEQMKAEANTAGPAYRHPADVHHDQHTPRYAVRFHPAGFAGHPYPSAQLSCRDCEWQQGWYRSSVRRDWADAWPFLSSWVTDATASHDATSHYAPSAPLRMPAWHGRRFA